MAELPGDPSAVPSAGEEAGDELVDVWSRTEPKYRVRAIALLAVNLALFCGLCTFAYWLREAKLFDFSIEAYLSPAVFWDDAPNLSDFLIEPISVQDTPIHAVVLGLLLGAMVMVPIVISILYRFVSALPFLAAVLIFAHMPWMAFTLMGSCVLASLPPFRMRFRFGSALLGMLPFFLYLLLAGGWKSDLGSASPTEQTLLAMPWVLGILAAAAMTAICLQLAKVLSHRPGPVAPVLSVMFATPVILFHYGVGIDELDYRVLEQQHGPRSRAFEPVQDPTPQILEMVQRIAGDEHLAALYLPDFLEALSGQPFSNPRLILQYLTVEFMGDRALAYEACRHFIADHPKSKYVPNVLFIQARVLDTRVDEGSLLRRRPQRVLYADFPHVQSERVWAALLNQYPESPLATAAALRLAQLHFRRGDFARGIELLGAITQGPMPPASQPSGEHLLASAPPEASLAYEAEPFLQEAWRLRELVSGNRNDPQYGNAPLEQFFRLDPHRVGYRQELQRLLDRFPDAMLADNLHVAYALSLPTPAGQASVLRELAERLPEGDARPEALSRLASIEIQLVQDTAELERSLARLRDVAEAYRGTFWGAEAARVLALYPPQVRAVKR